MLFRSMELFDRFLLPFSGLLGRLPLPSTLRLRAALQRLDGVIARMIDERRRDPAGRSDLLSMLLQVRDAEDGGGMSVTQVRDEAMTIFLAGHETTAQALTWTWYLLSEHPEVESALHEELDRVLGGRPPAVDDLPALTTTHAVVSESMRLYPPAWAIGRRALEDVELGGYVVPARSIVAMSQYVVHRDPRWWPQP